MGAGVSGWRLAQTVSRLGQLGVVAGTALDELLARHLQDGDRNGNIRRALKHFPLRESAQRILDAYFIPGGKSPDTPYRSRKMHSLEDDRETREMCIAGNFVEVFLAREGHENPVGINYLEKIQWPHLPSLYGAILAGVSVVIMGAGIPVEIPEALEALSAHRPAEYTAHVVGAESGRKYTLKFDPADFADPATLRVPLPTPAFLPIISSEVLANVLIRKTRGRLAGLIVEGNLAGGHNAPPRGAVFRTDDGQPVYGPRDTVDPDKLRKHGLPFWMAGAYGSPEGLRRALEAGASGIQVGSAFALCRESGLLPEARRELVRRLLNGTAEVYTDPLASPTGFPFKVAALEGSLSSRKAYEDRQRVCNFGFLREAYVRPDGKVGYRCPAEPVAAYVAKGGKVEDTVNRKCLCNALVANIGMPELLEGGEREKCLVTLGDDYVNLGRYCTPEHPDYGAEDVIRVLLSGIEA